MPIQGLTHKGASFPQIGTLRKGDEKKDERKPGADLTYFRFDSDDAAALATFEKAFGKEPRDIEILLPYATTDENFDAWKEQWTAGALQHRCDGITCVWWLTKQGKYSDEPIPCPGGCKQSGRLKVIIPALQRFAYVSVVTTSIWDILTIHQNLSALEMLRGSLQGVPLILRRVEREISTPGSDGKRARRKKWLITIEAKPEWVRAQLQEQLRAAMPPASEPLQLIAAPVDDDDEESIDPLELLRAELRSILTEQGDAAKVGKWWQDNVGHMDDEAWLRAKLAGAKKKAQAKEAAFDRAAVISQMEAVAYELVKAGDETAANLGDFDAMSNEELQSTLLDLQARKGAE